MIGNEHTIANHNHKNRIIEPVHHSMKVLLQPVSSFVEAAKSTLLVVATVKVMARVSSHLPALNTDVSTP